MLGWSPYESSPVAAAYDAFAAAQDPERVLRIGSGGQRGGVANEAVTTADLLRAWREATQAADLAERLARAAHESADEADASALADEEVATLAERAAGAADRAAEAAWATATRARELATKRRDNEAYHADLALSDTRAAEAEARDLYHEAESEARRRYERDKPQG